MDGAIIEIQADIAPDTLEMPNKVAKTISSYQRLYEVETEEYGFVMRYNHSGTSKKPPRQNKGKTE